MNERLTYSLVVSGQAKQIVGSIPPSAANPPNMPLIKPINLSSEGLLLKFIKMFLLLNFQIEKRTNINPIVVLKIVGSVKVNMSNPVGIPMTPKVTNDLSFVKSKVLRSLYMGRAETNKQETMFNEIAADGSRI